jgi:uncharacterized delta-60 repeat protein
MGNSFRATSFWLALVGSALACAGTPPGGDDAGPDAQRALDAVSPADAPSADAQAPDADVPPLLPGADPTFGTGGVAAINVGQGLSGTLWSVVLQRDGSLVASGRTPEALVVARTRPNGTLDTAFGRGGVAFAPLGALVTTLTGTGVGGVALTPDGKIVLVAPVLVIGTGAQREVLARFATDGTLDPTFGTGGLVVGASTAAASSANAVAVQADSRIVVAAYNHVDRYMPDGTLDPSFGTAGRFDAISGTTFVDYQAVTLQPDGRIVAAARHAAVSTGGRIAVVRLTSAGALDTTFGGTGYVLDTVADNGIIAPAFARGVTVQRDGKIVVAGARRASTTQQFALGRFNADGTVDTTFGASGWAVAPESGTYSGYTQGVAVQTDGAVIGVGTARVSGRTTFLTRFSTGGVFDTTFGQSGAGDFVTSAIALGIAIQPDDRIAIVGIRNSGAPLLSRVDRNGRTDTTFGTNGVTDVPLDAGFDRALAVAVQPDGRVLLGGTAGSLNTPALVRLMPDGTPDATFGTNGRVTTGLGIDAIGSIAVDASGRILVGGQSGALRVTRLTSAGAPDTAFGTNGLATGNFAEGSSSGANMAPAPDGGAYVAGFARGAPGTYYFGLRRVRADGTPDPTFGNGGSAVVPVSSAGRLAVLAAHPDGRVVAIGAGALVRFLANGTPDPAFGTNGVVARPNAIAIALQSDGKIVLVSTSGNVGQPVDLVVERRLADGTPDASFGTNGVATTTLGSVEDFASGFLPSAGLSIDPDGSILVGAATGRDGLTQRAALFRWTSAGVPVASFGTAGQLALPLGRGNSAVHAIAALPDGRVVLAGRAWTEAGSSDFIAVRMRLASATP